MRVKTRNSVTHVEQLLKVLSLLLQLLLLLLCAFRRELKHFQTFPFLFRTKEKKKHLKTPNRSFPSVLFVLCGSFVAQFGFCFIIPYFVIVSLQVYTRLLLRGLGMETLLFLQFLDS